MSDQRDPKGREAATVMAALVAAIHVFLPPLREKKDVAARHKAGHDGSESSAADMR
jgi:hypothetical protein